VHHYFLSDLYLPTIDTEKNEIQIKDDAFLIFETELNLKIN
jgi:hypothetical protein